MFCLSYNHYICVIYLLNDMNKVSSANYFVDWISNQDYWIATNHKHNTWLTLRGPDSPHPITLFWRGPIDISVVLACLLAWSNSTQNVCEGTHITCYMHSNHLYATIYTTYGSLIMHMSPSALLAHGIIVRWSSRVCVEKYNHVVNESLYLLFFHQMS